MPPENINITEKKVVLLSSY